MSGQDQRHQLRLVAGLAEQVGQPFIALDLPAGTTVEGLRQQLAALYPHIVPLLGKSLLVAGDRILDDHAPLPTGEPLALVPPAAGG